MKKAILSVELEGFKIFKKGKVRDIFDLGENLLIVATDRISAFDVVMPNGIPDKGKILTALSVFWFKFTQDIIENHLLSADIEEIISLYPALSSYREVLQGRTMLVKKSQPIPIECVVRGYLAGSGWREYREKGSISGIKLPPGLRESDKLPSPIFTPATKAHTGHDENITEKEAEKIAGKEVFSLIKEKSLALYEKAKEYAEERGIIIADTKFEFGIINGKVILIDEILTPDSSRFWPMDEYQPGKGQRSFDKQFVRDYLDSLDWDKTPPAPQLPPEIVKKTRLKYLEALKRLTGKQSLKNL